MVTEEFTRDPAHNKMIGLSEEEISEENENTIKPLGSFNDASVNNVADEIVQFNGPCPNCEAVCETNMKVTGKFFL